MGTETIEAAMAYAAHGWRVFPIHSVDSDGRCTCGRLGCQSPGKHPRTLHGFKDASSDLSRVQFAFEAYDNPNIGIATGAVSGMFVLDVDPKHGGMKSLNELQERFGPLPATVRALTGGGGDHYYFCHPGRPFTNKAAALGLAGIDIRGDGGYVAAPPSLHASGRQYEWMLGCDWRGDLTEAPPSLVAAIERYAPARRPVAGAGAVMTRIPDGQRHHAILRLAGALRRKGLGTEAIHAAIVAEDKRLCDPPIMTEDEGEQELRAMAEYCGEKPADAPVLSMPKDDHPVVTDAPIPESAQAETEPEHPHRPRRPAIDIIIDYLIDTVRLVSRRDAKAYSERDGGWYTATEWRHSYDPDVFDLLLAEAEEITPGDLEKCTTRRAKQKLAREVWNLWAVPAFRRVLRDLSEHDDADEITAQERAVFARDIIAALVKDLMITDNDAYATPMRGSVIGFAQNNAAVAWKKIGQHAAWCRAGPQLAVRYEFLVAYGGPSIKRYKSKTKLARDLNSAGIAATDSPVGGTRMYVFSELWLSETFDIKVEQVDELPAPAEHDVKRAAAGDTEKKDDDIPF